MAYRKRGERNSRLYIGTTNHVACLDQATGQMIWKQKLPRASRLYQGLVTLLLYGQQLYAGAAKCVARLDPLSGEVIWATQVKKLLPPMTLALDEGEPGGLLIAAGIGMVFGLDASRGSQLWQNDLPKLGYQPVTVRAPDAVVASPRPYFIQQGKAKVVTQLDNEQDYMIGVVDPFDDLE